MKTDMKMFIIAMVLFLLVLLFLAGCKKKGGIDDDEWRPPVLAGKCVVDRYFEHKVHDQWCDYNHYMWKCGPDDCVRTGESKGERPAPAAVDPVPQVAPAPALVPAPGSGT